MSLGSEHVVAAASVLDGIAHRTPVFSSRTLDRRLDATIVFKAEQFQRGGAFKFRGAYHALHRLGREQRAQGVLSWSSGNHAGGLALAGRLLGAPVTVVMPENSVAIKRDAARAYGARIVSCEAREREAVGTRIAQEQGLSIIPPYDHPHIIAGQGTAALELLEQAVDLDLVLTPVGGGGLLAGAALAASGVSPSPQVIGVEPARGDDAAQSFRAGRIVTIDVPDTIADGLRTRYLGAHNFAVIRRHVHDIVTVEEDDILQALRFLWLRMKLLVEPSAAVPLAALLCGRIPVAGRRVGVILSGGNVDPASIAALIGG